MELCERSRTSKFSAPLKPWMDVSLLWPSRRTRKLLMFSQSTNEMAFSYDKKKLRKKRKRKKRKMAAVTHYILTEYWPVHRRSRAVVTGWCLPGIWGHSVWGWGTEGEYTERGGISCSLANPPGSLWLPEREAEVASGFRGFTELWEVKLARVTWPRDLLLLY